MPEKQLPTWGQCQRRVDEGNPSALERFIYDNEPTGFEETKKFRSQLVAAINEAVSDFAAGVLM